MVKLYKNKTRNVLVICFKIAAVQTVVALVAASAPRSGAPSSPPAASPAGAGTGWRNRRSQKLDKMEILTLQSSLHSEIQAKQAVGEELSRTRAELLASQRSFVVLFVCLGFAIKFLIHNFFDLTSSKYEYCTRMPCVFT